MPTRFDTQTINEQGAAAEGRATKATESVTAKLPSGSYLTAAVAAMIASAVLQVVGKQRLSLFVGQWAPSILIMGLYNKLVRVVGSE